MWLSGILGHGVSSLISQWGTTIKSPWVCNKPLCGPSQLLSLDTRWRTGQGFPIFNLQQSQWRVLSCTARSHITSPWGQRLAEHKKRSSLACRDQAWTNTTSGRAAPHSNQVVVELMYGLLQVHIVPSRYPSWYDLSIMLLGHKTTNKQTLPVGQHYDVNMTDAHCPKSVPVLIWP